MESSTMDKLLHLPWYHLALFLSINKQNVEIATKFLLQFEFSSFPLRIQETILRAFDKAIGYLYHAPINEILSDFDWNDYTPTQAGNSKSGRQYIHWLARKVLMTWANWDQSSAVRREVCLGIKAIEGDMINRSCERFHRFQARIQSTKHTEEQLGSKRKRITSGLAHRNYVETISSASEYGRNGFIDSLEEIDVHSTDIAPLAENFSSKGWIDEFVWQSLEPMLASHDDATTADADDTHSTPIAKEVDVPTSCPETSNCVESYSLIIQECSKFGESVKSRSSHGPDASALLNLVRQISTIGDMPVFTQCVCLLRMWTLNDEICAKVVDELLIAQDSHNGLEAADENELSREMNSIWAVICGGMILPKVRLLTSPASRILIKIFEKIIASNTSSILIDCTISNIMRPLTIHRSIFGLGESLSVFPGPVQWELIQRISRQVLLPRKLIPTLLTSVFRSQLRYFDANWAQQSSLVQYSRYSTLGVVSSLETMILVTNDLDAAVTEETFAKLRSALLSTTSLVSGNEGVADSTTIVAYDALQWDPNCLRAINSILQMGIELPSPTLASMIGSIETVFSGTNSLTASMITVESWTAISTLLNTIISKQSTALRGDAALLRQDLQRLLLLITSPSIGTTDHVTLPPQSAVIVARNALNALKKLHT